MINILEGALFVADSHYPSHGDEFLRLLRLIESGSIRTPQLFLMGDNFDLLFGYNNHVRSYSWEAVKLLQKLSTALEIYYFEGNHDFLLFDIFTNIKIYPREKQPVSFELNGKRIAIAHGDRYALGWVYGIFTNILRTRAAIAVISMLGKRAMDRFMDRQARKHICNPFEGFEQRAGEIMVCYGDVDLVIEGHYHQAKVFDRYCSLPSLACQKEIGLIRNGKLIFVPLKMLVAEG